MSKLQEMTDRLADLRYSIEDVDKQYDEVVKPLNAEKVLLEYEILKELKGQGLHATPEAKTGEYFLKGVTTMYTVTDEDAAQAWGLKNKAISLDKIKANSILRHLPLSKVPACFEAVDKEKLTIKRPMAIKEE